MFDIVTAHQHQPALAVDGGGVHHSKARLAVFAAGNECAKRQIANDTYDDKQHKQPNQHSNRPYEYIGRFRSHAFQQCCHVAFLIFGCVALK